MADGMEIVLTGMAELEGILSELTVAVLEKIVRKGMRAAGQVVQRAIVEAAPVRTPANSGTALPPGALQADITLRVAKENDGSISAIIQPGKYTAHVAVFVEYGHRLIAGEGQESHGGYREKGDQIGEVPAHPFFRPAFEASAPEAMTVAEDTIMSEISKEASRLGLVG